MLSLGYLRHQSYSSRALAAPIEPPETTETPAVAKAEDAPATAAAPEETTAAAAVEEYKQDEHKKEKKPKSPGVFDKCVHVLLRYAAGQC